MLHATTEQPKSRILRRFLETRTKLSKEIKITNATTELFRDRIKTINSSSAISTLLGNDNILNLLYPKYFCNAMPFARHGKKQLKSQMSKAGESDTHFFRRFSKSFYGNGVPMMMTVRGCSQLFESTRRNILRFKVALKKREHLVSLKITRLGTTSMGLRRGKSPKLFFCTSRHTHGRRCRGDSELFPNDDMVGDNSIVQ